MFMLLKATFALFCVIEHISSLPTNQPTLKAHHPERAMREIVWRITNITSGVQMPCNNTRVMKVKFTDPKLPESEKLCQATMALTSVTKCKMYYHGLLSNLFSLLGNNKNCLEENGDEIYLRNFLPQLGNYTQGLIRNLKHITRSVALGRPHLVYWSQTWVPHSRKAVDKLEHQEESNKNAKTFRESKLGGNACDTLVVLGGPIKCEIYLKEIIKTLDNITEQEVSCGEMNVTNIFASTKFTASPSSVNSLHPSKCPPLVLGNDRSEMLCKAANVISDARHCHRYTVPWKVISANLSKLIPKVRCPTTAANTTTLKNFLEDLKDFTKSIMKDSYSSIKG